MENSIPAANGIFDGIGIGDVTGNWLMPSASSSG
jgi:hypothetical protein